MEGTASRIKDIKLGKQVMLKQLFIAGLALGSTVALATAAQAQDGYYGQTIENAEVGETIKARDYTITRTGSDTTLGNGVDESVSWLFDFSKDQNLDAFLADTSELVEARLVLMDIEISDPLATNDLLGIPGYKGMEYATGINGGAESGKADSSLLLLKDVVEDIEQQEVGNLINFSIDLLDYSIDDAALLGALLDTTDNVNPWYKDTWVGDKSDYVIENKEYAIPFIYMDDAIIRKTQLVLTKENSSISSEIASADVPEPTAMAGLAVAGAALLMRRRKQQAA